MTFIDFTLSNARRFYSSMGNSSAVKGLIDGKNPPIRNEVQNACHRLYSALEAALSVMENLSEQYSRQGDRYNRKRVKREIQQLKTNLPSFKVERRNIWIKQNRILRH